MHDRCAGAHLTSAAASVDHPTNAASIGQPPVIDGVRQAAPPARVRDVQRLIKDMGAGATGRFGATGVDAMAAG